MNNLTTAQAAERLKVGQSTVNLWCRQGRFPHAERVETPQGGYWLIPESDLTGFEPPKIGRPPKAKAEIDAKASKKKGHKK
jgi:excisionase family DNA binding protein